MKQNEQHTEQEWIARLQAGEEEAYAWLFDRYYELLCRMACVWLRGDAYTAQTVVGDVVFRIWRGREGWRVERSLRSYLIRAVRNGCLNVLQSAPYTRQVPLSDAEPAEFDAPPAALPPTPYGLLIEHEFEDRVQEALDALPEKTKEVFVKCRIDGLSYAQTAEELGISPHTVKYHLTAAVKLLHDRLKAYLPVLCTLSIGTAGIW